MKKGRKPKYFTEEERVSARREYDRKWLAKPGNYEQHLVWAREHARRYKFVVRHNPELHKRYLVRQKVARAIASGKLQRGPCIVEGCSKATQAHHHNYDAPLDVIWICSKHHKEWHVFDKKLSTRYNLDTSLNERKHMEETTPVVEPTPTEETPVEETPTPTPTL